MSHFIWKAQLNDEFSQKYWQKKLLANSAKLSQPAASFSFYLKIGVNKHISQHFPFEEV